MMEQYDINDDIWFNILLQVDINTLKIIYIINKTTTRISNNINFWKIKLKQEGITFIKLQFSLKQWINEYTSIKDTISGANKMVNYMFDNKLKYFKMNHIIENRYTICLDISKVIYSSKLNKVIEKSNKSDEYFYIVYNYSGKDEDKVITDCTEPYKFTKIEFGMHLAQLLYYFPDMTFINGYNSVTNIEVFITYPFK